MNDEKKQETAAALLIMAQMEKAQSEGWQFLSDLYTMPLESVQAILARLYDVVPDEYVSLAVAAQVCLEAVNDRINEVTRAVEEKYGRQAATVSRVPHKTFPKILDVYRWEPQLEQAAEA